MKTIVSRTALSVAALIALTAASAAQAQKVSRDATALTPLGPRGLLTGTVSPKMIHRADGSQEIESDESMLHTMVLVRQPDGTMKQFCVPNTEIARRLAAGERVSFAKNMLERANDR